MTGWSASGLYASALASQSLTGVAAATYGWNQANVNKFFMTTNSDTPVYSGLLSAAGSAYASTNEATGTNWAAGGINMSALGAGPSSIAPAFTVTGTTVVNWTASNVSVATTTISTAAYGGYFYSTTNSNYKIIGIYFGGTGYTTVAGTFAITWSGGVICAITVATTS
jgi:hypothetical protein